MAYTVGLRMTQVRDEAGDTDIKLLLMYPTEQAESPHRFGPYTIEAARDAAPAPRQFPLVLVSHGTGSSQFVLRTLAQHLARNGWVVAIPEHPFNNRNDDSLAFTAANLANRPRHLKVVADFMLGAAPVAAAVAPGGYAVIGHSMGAYTALAVAGGVPTTTQHMEGDERPLEVTHDARARALVLLGPATVWFRKPGALANVGVPTLMLLGGADRDASYEFHGNIVINGLPSTTPLTWRVVDGANHFAFQSVFPPEMARPGFRPAEDEPDFDRPAFLAQMNAEILAFLNAHRPTK